MWYNRGVREILEDNLKRNYSSSARNTFGVYYVDSMGEIFTWENFWELGICEGVISVEISDPLRDFYLGKIF